MFVGAKPSLSCWVLIFLLQMKSFLIHVQWAYYINAELDGWNSNWMKKKYVANVIKLVGVTF